MGLKPKIVLVCGPETEARLPDFVERCIRDGVKLVASVGLGCQGVEEAIDWLVVGDGADHDRFLVTTSHPDAAVEDAIHFAAVLYSDPPGEPQVVVL